MNTMTVSVPTMGAILDADNQGLAITALKTAMELDVFETIAQGYQRAEEIARVANCNIRGMTILLNALCTMELLDKYNGRYQLNARSETYLIRGGQGYCVPIYLAWLQAREHFIDFVRTGNPTINLMDSEAEDMWVSYAASERVRLPELQELAIQRWDSAGMIPLPIRNASILDIGSGSGFKSFSLLPGNPDAHITAVDSPKVLDVARDVAEIMGVSHQVSFQSGDLLTSIPAESFDMVIFGNLLHYFDPDTSIGFLRKAYRALKPNGMVVIFSKGVEETRTSDPALLSNIDVSNCGPNGETHTAFEYKDMLAAAGFKSLVHFEPSITRGTKKIV